MGNLRNIKKYVKRSRKSRAAKLREKKLDARQTVKHIVDILLNNVEKEKLSTKVCELILDDVLENVWHVHSVKIRSEPSTSTCNIIEDDDDINVFGSTQMSPSLQSIPSSTSENWDIESASELVMSPSKSNTSNQHEYDFSDPSILKEYESIMEHNLNIEMEQDVKNISGCRIVDIDYFLKQAMRLQIRHNKKCTGGQLNIMNEKRIGLESTFIFKCNICDKELNICNEDPNKPISVINRASVWATLSTGSTYTHLAELLSILDIPPLSSNLFYKIQRQLSLVWKDSLWYTMKEAGEEERFAALEKGHVDASGTPFITVYLDGGWSKRSYGHTYNAASGVAVIIGKHTGKLLFVGVRNKYCSICARAENVGQNVSDHLCFKNWNSSSAAMEQDIIVEGFSNSMIMHDVKYLKFIADGDSSVYTKIKEKVSYGPEVIKIECMNHVLKNYSKSLYKIKNNVKGVSLQARKMLSKDIINELVLSVQAAIYGNTQDPENLRSDIRNSINHVFGNHFSCKPYICTNVGDVNQDRTANLITSGAHHHIYGAMSQLITKAHMLLDKETNNRAELFMSLMARFNMGKRLNLIQRDSFQMRSHLTGLKYNEGHAWHRKPWKAAFGRSPGLHLKKYINSQQKKVEYSRQRPHKKPKVVKKLKLSGTESQADYGPNIAEVELADEDLKKEVENLCDRLKVSEERQIQIWENTVGQFENPVYVTERMHRLTASHFGAVVKRRISTPCDSLVKRILNPSTFQTPAIAFGKANEIVAISKFEEKTGKKVQPSGLFVDTSYGFLGASPDGVINKEEIVEVKCLYKVANSGKNLKTAVEDKDVACLCFENGEIRLKRTHDYYYQIQGQLAITKASICHFIIYSGDQNDLFIQEIGNDYSFWKTIQPKLVKFYIDCVAPEIILNRRGKKRKCKDPQYIIKAQGKKKKIQSDI